MGFEYWEVGFGKKLGWEMGLVPPLQDPHYKVHASVKIFKLSDKHIDSISSWNVMLNMCKNKP